MPEFQDKTHLEDVTVIGEREISIRVEYDGDKLWVPKSVIDDDSEVWKLGQRGTLVVWEKWAFENRLI